MIKVSCCFIK